MTEAAIKNLTSRLEAVSTRLEVVEKQLAAGGGGAAPSSSVAAAGEAPSKSLGEFDGLVAEYIGKYVELSAQINPLVKQQADLVKQAVQAHRDLLAVASQAKKPSDNVLASLLKPTNDLVAQIIDLRDKNRAHANFNHLSTLSEGVTAFNWVVMSPTPGPHVDESRSSSEFYSNKLLMQYRHDQSEAGKLQVAWVGAWNTFLKELRQWIRNYHTTGLTWNPSGGDAASFVGKAPAASSSGGSSGGPPPPGPPPPPVDLDFSSPSPSKGGASAHAALFAEINAVRDRQQGGHTEGLRKVTKEMKTKYQDPASRPAVTPKAGAGAGAPKRGTSSAPARPPKFALEGSKWVVEHQVGNRELVIDNPEARHTVYIYKCEDSVLQINGKVNAITMDSCKKTGVVFNNAIAVAEVVNCNSVQVQVKGGVPAIQVDKTSGCQIFLSSTSLHTEIITSKSDEMNVCLPAENEADDIQELAVPEQFKTVIENRKLKTEAVAHV